MAPEDGSQNIAMDKERQPEVSRHDKQFAAAWRSPDLVDRT
jgi:hypothetical protein